MKIAQVEKIGEDFKLEIKEVSKPKISMDEVLVKVKSIALNPVDLKLMTNKSISLILKEEDFPWIPCFDICGIVEESTCDEFKVGAHVIGMINFPKPAGACSEYIVVKPNEISLINDNVSFDDGAGINLVGLTTLQVFEDGNLKKDDRILILGASGGVGHIAVQLAKKVGAYVIGVCSSKNKEFVKGLGADEVVCYDIDDISKVQDIDLVMDCVGVSTLDDSLKTLTAGGKFVSILINLKKIKPECGVDSSVVIVKSNKEQLNYLAKCLNNNSIKVEIAKKYSFDEVNDAFMCLGSGKNRGKIIINL